MARSSTSSKRPDDLPSSHNERVEPRLLRAAENDDEEQLASLVEEAKLKGQLNDNFLRIGLMRSSEKGKVNATLFLLQQGAKPDSVEKNRLSPLLRAVTSGHIAIVQLLAEHGANLEVADKDGRTALMTAAWKNSWHILSILLSKGANPNTKDNKGRNVLHNLAADKKCDWGDSVIELLLRQSIRIDGPEGQDELSRSPLHWACATGKLRLAEQLLTRIKKPSADINAVEIRGKTALHIAVTHDKTHSRDDIVEMLLRYRADVNAKSDGGWTPLHNACEKATVKIVQILVNSGADVNAKLLNGMTPLHVAAQAGDIEIVKYLLEQRDIKRAARDNFGITPFLLAAQNRRKDIASMLAPFNQVQALSENALGACHGFNATIVDFGNFHNGNQVKKCSVHELLYGRDAINSRKAAINILPKDTKATEFRWIHLPANNMAWVEALLTKWFIEEGAGDVDGFKALERSFSHQHRGQQSHSHFMRPLCQITPRAVRLPDDETGATLVEPPTPTIIINSTASKLQENNSTKLSTSEEKEQRPKSPYGGKENNKGTPKEKGRRSGYNTPKLTKHDSHYKDQRKTSNHDNRFRPVASPNRREPLLQAVNANVFTFMPYLHFETDRKRQEMQNAIKRAEIVHSHHVPSYLSKPHNADEMLIRAHLATSTVSLHVRRTLDQSFYHNIDTQSRDEDQVVYRYQKRSKNSEEADPKILMVDQLWMWILGKDLIVTSFPQRWQQPKNDPLNVLDGVIEDINSKIRDQVKSVFELSMIISGRCTGVFSRNRVGDDDYRFLDMFESSIGSATDRETKLFKEFNEASSQASAWLQHHKRPNPLSKMLAPDGASEDEASEKEKIKEFTRGPVFIDKLLDIGQETDLLAETKDIRDELNMINKVLNDQLQVIPELQSAVCEIYGAENRSQQEIKKRFKDQLKSIEVHLKDIDRMDKQAARIYSSITDMLDLKQKHANAFEARFARDQAGDTARQSQTVMVFTIVTIIFLPLSFIASVFTINIREFPRDSAGNESLPLSYVSKYMFGIGFAISIPLILLALSLDDIVDFFRQIKSRIRKPKPRPEKMGSGTSDSLEMLNLELALSAARTARKSIESTNISRILSRDRPASAVSRNGVEHITGFKMRVSRDIERGLHP